MGERENHNSKNYYWPCTVSVILKEETNVGVLGPTYGCFLENIWSKDVPKVYTKRSPISDHNINLDIWEVMLRHHIHHFFYAIIMGLKPLTLDFTSLSGIPLGLIQGLWLCLVFWYKIV